MSGFSLNDSTVAEELEKRGSAVYNTKGASMRPLLVQGQTHVVLKKLEGEAKKNDIVLYRRKNGQLVLHRLIKTKGDIYYIRGDNTFGFELVEKSSAIAVAETVYKNGKYIDFNGFRYKAYVFFHNLIYPLRFLKQKLSIRRRLGDIYRKLFKR